MLLPTACARDADQYSGDGVTEPQPLVYVGTYTEGELRGRPNLGRGIYTFRFTGEGVLETFGLTAEMRNPSYLAFDYSQRALFAVSEVRETDGVPGGTVNAYTIGPSGELKFLNKNPSGGLDPCHLAVSEAHCVFVSNYTSGSLSVLPILAGGVLGTPCDTRQHLGAGSDRVRQDRPHVHSALFDPCRRHVYVCDLGLDRIMIYGLDPATLRLTETRVPVTTKRRSGPRQFALHPNRKYLYLLNELDSTITAYLVKSDASCIDLLQTISTVPRYYWRPNLASEIRISPSGRHLYSSNRGHDSIAIYSVSLHDGSLSLLGHEKTLGRTPRSFDISPEGDYLVVANQGSDILVVFRMDPLSGRLQRTGNRAKVPSPVCVRFWLPTEVA
jgi:6-phosphogluconolactonase